MNEKDHNNKEWMMTKGKNNKKTILEEEKMQLQGINEEQRSTHRSQKRDHVRAHWQRQLEGLKEAMTQTIPINHPNHQWVVPNDGELHIAKSNIQVVTYEDEVAAHKIFC